MPTSTQSNDELDFSEQIKSEVDKGNLIVPGITKTEAKEEEGSEGVKTEATESIGQDLAVLLSSRILKCLESKSKEFDCNIEQLITIFKNSTTNFSCSTATKMQWGIARVNQYLKTIKNKKDANISQLDYTVGTVVAVEESGEVDLFEGVSPSELDEAFADIKKFDLAGLSFSSWDDLYIEDRDKDCSFELLRKYI
jgi:hypothetical protein